MRKVFCSEHIMGMKNGSAFRYLNVIHAKAITSWHKSGASALQRLGPQSKSPGAAERESGRQMFLR